MVKKRRSSTPRVNVSFMVSRDVRDQFRAWCARRDLEMSKVLEDFMRALPTRDQAAEAHRARLQQGENP